MKSTHSTHSTLPIPNDLALAHSRQLTKYITEQIDIAGGAISFEKFMQLALYTPNLGYYSADLRKFGESGDFITAPELSPLFSQCLAHQCAQLFENNDILEFGAGSGEMALDILNELQRLDKLPEHYYIVEISESLKQRQQEKLQSFKEKVVWLEHLPEQFEGVILANEVLDAMPVKKFHIAENGEIQEWFVSLKENENENCFKWTLQPADEIVEKAVRNLNQNLPANYSSEISLFLNPWIQSLGEILKKGAIILIDYGFPRREYYHPQRDQGTLMCHYRHYAHGDPLLYVGLQDITAHVDFTAIAEVAQQASLDLIGYTSQGDFLLQGGLLNLITNFEELPMQERLKFAQQIKQLTLPHEMGELFKVIGLSKNLDIQLPAFRNDRSFML
jgi:SAM-dependent MidA family methyltransferase